MEKGYLLLESGQVFPGTRVGASRSVMGEIVFNTGMTGYQEMMTDPSYAGQIMAFCYPLIGNYGISPDDSESAAIHMQGVLFSSLCPLPSHYRSLQTVDQWLKQARVPGLAHVDTRAIVRAVRRHGTMKAAISDSPEIGRIDWSRPLPADQVARVSCKQVTMFAGSGPHVVLIDYGYKKSMLQALLDLGCRVTVVPYNTDFTAVAALHPDGVLLSNGPGDPRQLCPFFGDIKKISSAFPTLGICLGHQLIACAYGAATEKLLFGHRGANHPVKETATGKVWMTAQNHSYVVKKESIDGDQFTISYLHVNDGSVEGLKHRTLPIETVQFHPEAHSGPADTYALFRRFVGQMKQGGGERAHATAYGY